MNLPADRPPPLEFIRFLATPATLTMLALVLAQELFAAGTTWLVILIARDLADGQWSMAAFAWIIAAQSVSYVCGAASWLYAERAGFFAYARYVLRFARINRYQTSLLQDSEAREAAEPFLTGEVFQICFNVIYDLQFNGRLLFSLLFNAVVFGIEIDAGLPAAYGAAFALLAGLQWMLRKPLASAYLLNQSMTNRMTARTYNAWDNVTTGNAHNLRLWQRDFRRRWDQALSAQVRAVLLREGWSALSGVIALLVVLGTTAWVASRESADLALLLGLAATLPRQLEMTIDLHQLTAGLTDLIAIWARMQGACAQLYPTPDPAFNERIDGKRISVTADGSEVQVISLDEALRRVLANATGRVALRGGNGSGKSTLLTALKGCLRGHAFYWPSQDRLNFQFNTGMPGEPAAEPLPDEDETPEADELSAIELARDKAGYSSGERQLQVLRELVATTDQAFYLLDEWDANLDVDNRLEAEHLLDILAQRARVVEVSHFLPAQQ